MPEISFQRRIDEIEAGTYLDTSDNVRITDIESAGPQLYYVRFQTSKSSATVLMNALDLITISFYVL